MQLVFWLGELIAVSGIVSLLVTVPMGDLTEVLLASILALVMPSILAGFLLCLGSIRACGRGTFRVSTSLFPFSFLAMPILLLLFPGLLGGLLGLRTTRGLLFWRRSLCSIGRLLVRIFQR